MTENGLVTILSKATPKAVLVSLEEWNRVAHCLSDLEFNEKARSATQEWRESGEPDISFDEFMAGLRAHHGQESE